MEKNNKQFNKQNNKPPLHPNSKYKIYYNSINPINSTALKPSFDKTNNTFDTYNKNNKFVINETTPFIQKNDSQHNNSSGNQIIDYYINYSNIVGFLIFALIILFVVVKIIISWTFSFFAI